MDDSWSNRYTIISDELAESGWYLSDVGEGAL